MNDYALQADRLAHAFNECECPAGDCDHCKKTLLALEALEQQVNKPTDLNEKEWEVLQALHTSSDANGHDFGFSDEPIEGYTAHQWAGYVGALASKGYIVCDGGHVVNEGSPYAETVHQFELTAKGHTPFGTERPC